MASTHGARTSHSVWPLVALTVVLLGACGSEDDPDGPGDGGTVDAGAGPDAGGGPGDAGLRDAGRGEDAGTADAGAVDDGGLDAGPADGGPADGGASDGGSVDGGEAADGGPLDGGPLDGGLDAGAEPDGGGGRTPVTGRCARTQGSCTRDSDCAPSGCSGEVCASEDVFSTCDCTPPTGADCGCVAGSCGWYR